MQGSIRARRRKMRYGVNWIRFGFILMLFCGVLPCSAEDERKLSSSVDLGGVVVTPSRVGQSYRDTTQNVSVVDADTIQSAGMQDTAEALETLPSVNILDYGGIGSFKGIQLRGSASNQALILIDGRPVNVSRDGLADFSQIPLGNIERIEVLRGPASSMYGSNAVGGVVNVITKAGVDTMQTQLQSTAGSFSTFQQTLTHGYRTKGFDYFLTYENASSRGFRDNSGYLSNAGSVKLGYQLGKDQRIGVSSGYLYSRIGSPGLITNVDLDDRQDTVKQYLDLTYQGKAGDSNDVIWKYYRNSDRLEFIESFHPMDKTTHVTALNGTDAQVSHFFTDWLRAAVGGSFQQHQLDSTASAKHEYSVKAFYTDAEITFFDKSTFKTGLRWDDYSNCGDRLSPSASINYWLLEKVKLHALAARSFRAPTFNDLFWPREDWGVWGGVEGNPHLGPEKAVSYEAGVTNYLMDDTLTVDVTLFKTQYTDLIEWVADTAWWWRPQNISAATTQGLECAVEYTVNDQLKANVNYTYLESENRSTHKWLIYRPRHVYKAQLMYKPCKRVDMGIEGVHKTKRYADEANTVMLKHFTVMNMNAAYHFSDTLQLLLQIKNVFDRQYQEEKDYSLPGRAFYGGFKLTF